MAVEFRASDEALGEEAHLVTVRGELDLFTAPDFKQHLSAATGSGRPLVIVDLAEATLLDSSSLGVLISAHRAIALAEGRLVIACDVESILSTFRITGLDGLLEIVSSREDAMSVSAREPSR